MAPRQIRASSAVDRTDPATLPEDVRLLLATIVGTPDDLAHPTVMLARWGNLGIAGQTIPQDEHRFVAGKNWKAEGGNRVIPASPTTANMLTAGFQELGVGSGGYEFINAKPTGATADGKYIVADGNQLATMRFLKDGAAITYLGQDKRPIRTTNYIFNDADSQAIAAELAVGQFFQYDLIGTTEDGLYRINSNGDIIGPYGGPDVGGTPDNTIYSFSLYSTTNELSVDDGYYYKGGANNAGDHRVVRQSKANPIMEETSQTELADLNTAFAARSTLTYV